MLAQFDTSGTRELRVQSENVDCELHFVDENDMRDQKMRAEVAKLRADTRKVQIDSGEISPAIARQLAVDSEDLPRELIADDATAGGSISDDEKVISEAQTPTVNPALLALLQSEPTQPPKPSMAMKATDDESAALLEEELTWAKKLSKQARKQ